MSDRIQYIILLSSLAVIALIFQLVRKNKLLEQYSILWFISAIFLLIFAINRNLLDKMASFLGIYYAPSVLLVIIFFFGFLLFLHFSIIISKLTNNCKDLAQELAILRNHIEVLESRDKSAENTIADK